MRINPDSSSDMLYFLSETQQQQNTELERISSGRRISKPSDDPSGMAALIYNRSAVSANDEYSQSLSTTKALLQTGDSTLSSVITQIQRAITLGVEGATGTLSQENRDAIAAEVNDVRENIGQLANVAVNGRYLFSGTSSADKPFTEDDSQEAGVIYSGNSHTTEVALSQNCTIQINVPGDQIFLSPNGNVFEGLTKLAAALKSGDTDAISGATDELQNGFNEVNTQRVFFGNALSQLQSTDAFLQQNNLDLSDQENDIAGADLADSISRMLNAQTARNATLAAAGQISRLSLLDYLK